MSSKKSKKATIEQVLNTPVSVTIDGREFLASPPTMGEAYLVNRFALLELQMQTGDFEEGKEAQAKYNEVWARLLTPRAADGQPVTAEWIGQQRPDALAGVINPQQEGAEGK